MNSVLKTILGVFILLLPVSCINEPEGDNDIKAGDRLPDFTVIMNDGSTLCTADLSGSASMIVFFNTTCPDCRKELPRINEYALENSDVRVLCISRNEGVQDIENFWEQEHLSLPYSAQTDAKIYNMFARTGIPRIYMADANLTVTAVYVEEFPFTN